MYSCFVMTYSPRFGCVLSCFFSWKKVATFAFGVAFGARGVWTYVGLLLHSMGVHWLLCGVVMSSFCRWGFGQHKH